MGNIVSILGNFFEGRFGKRVLLKKYRVWWQRFWVLFFSILFISLVYNLLIMVGNFSKMIKYMIYG